MRRINEFAGSIDLTLVEQKDGHINRIVRFMQFFRRQFPEQIDAFSGASKRMKRERLRGHAEWLTRRLLECLLCNPLSLLRIAIEHE